MKPFIDIVGASGAIYRFHRIQGPGQFPATAGNFVFIRSDDDNGGIICCGTASSLLLVKVAWRSAVDQHHADTIYMRLNVSHAIRDAEHDDIVAKQQPIMVVTDQG